MEDIELGNLILRAGDTGIFLGKIKENKVHEHYALQLTIGVNGPFELKSEKETYTTDWLVVRPQVSHQLDSLGNTVLILLINPASAVGHFIGAHLISKPIDSFEDDWINYLRMFATDFIKEEITEKTFLSACINSMAQFNGRCLRAKHQIDKRVLASLQYLDRHTREIVPLSEMAEEMCLSESRFSHLFKEHTGISFSRMQLWKRLLGSFDFLRECKTLTEMAHAAGFTDSAHYTKTFKESFGLTPTEAFSNTHLHIR